MCDWTVDFRDNCTRLLNSTENGNVDNVNFEDILNLIENPFILNKMRLSGHQLIYIPPNMLKNPSLISSLDSYYRTIDFYEWHKISAENGAEFSSINYLLTEIEKKHPDEKNILGTIYRKDAYLNILQMELQYISDRYLWEEKPALREVFFAKFENLTTSLIELIMTCINVYERIVLGKTEMLENYGEIVDFLSVPTNNLPSHYHLGINHSINLSFYIYIRNCLVHNLSEIEYVDNEQNPILKIDNIPHSRRYGLFDTYIEKEFEKFNGKKTAKSFQEHRDDRFPHVSLKFWITKKSTLGLEESKIGFEMPILGLTKNMLGYLFGLQLDLFTVINDMN